MSSSVATPCPLADLRSYVQVALLCLSCLVVRLNMRNRREEQENRADQKLNSHKNINPNRV